MVLLTYYILLLQFLYYTIAAKCVNNNVPDYITWNKELWADLESGRLSCHALNESKVVNVTYALIAFYMNSEEEIMTMQTYLNTKWIDERLKWDPKKHHGIEETDITQLYLWTPEFRLLNTEDWELYSEMFILYRYNLKSSGLVDGAKSIVQDSMCTVKLTNWPYDVQECSFHFGPPNSYWDSENYSINFNFIVVERKSAEWYIYDYNQITDNSTSKNVKVTFFLMREAVGLAAIVIYPAFILTVLSILPLCLDVRRPVRLSISCFSLLCHYNFLRELAYNIQKQCHYPPTLLLYYRGSVVLNILIILLTFVLAEVCKRQSSPHNYIKIINDCVYYNNYRYFVFPRWACDDDSMSSKDDWLKFANFVNSVFMLFIVFAYIGLYGTKIPKPTHHDEDYQYSMFDNLQ